MKLSKVLCALLIIAVLPTSTKACMQVVRDLQLAELTVSGVECNSTANVSVVVSNKGEKIETSTLRFFVDKSEVWPCTRVITVEPNESTSYSCNWQTVVGTHTIRAVIEPLIGESNREDNEKSLQVDVFCCSEGFLNEYRCSGNWVQQKYQHADCSVEWMNSTFCPYGCSDNQCQAMPTVTDVVQASSSCPVTAVVQAPSHALTGDTVEMYVQLTNSGDQHADVTVNAYVCSSFCWLMPCSSTVSLEPNSSYSLGCPHFFQTPGVYQFIVDYEACGSKHSTSSGILSVSNVRPTVYFYQPVESAEPLLFLNKYYTIRKCNTSAITFEILNTGIKSSNFSISIDGDAAGWISIPASIAIDKYERKTVTAYVSVPCDVREGSYEFSVRVKNSRESSSTSFLKVVSEAYPISIPVKPVILSVLVLVLLVLLVKRPKTRREPEYFKLDC